MSRNAIFNALASVAAGIQLNGSAAFAETGRRLKSPDQAQMPALFQVEPQETIQTPDGRLRKRTIEVMWFIYHTAGADQSAIPASTSADLFDAIEAALAPDAGQYQTLGGLVFAAFIDGQVRKWDGDLDGTTIMIIPIKLILP